MTYRRTTAQVEEIRHQDELESYDGWTISGLAVLATIGAVWMFAI